VPGLGTLINVVAILAGTIVGLSVGHLIPERIRTTMLQGVGIVTLVLGVAQGIQTHNIVFPLVALVAGGVIGEAARLEERLEALGERLRRRVEREVDPEVEGVPSDVRVEAPGRAPLQARGPSQTPLQARGPSQTPLQARGPSQTPFVEGFVAASLLFGIGPMAILGSIQDGLNGEVELLVVKAALDGLVSIIFASTLGWGVGFSVLPVGIYQALLTAGAGAADRLLDERMVTEMTATGGLIIIGIALRLLDLKQVRVASFLPALAIAPALVAAFAA
jgi:uncharacterized membrane protein YqgA involved in biofilm formation